MTRRTCAVARGENNSRSAQRSKRRRVELRALLTKLLLRGLSVELPTMISSDGCFGNRLNVGFGIGSRVCKKEGRTDQQSETEPSSKRATELDSPNTGAFLEVGNRAFVESPAGIGDEASSSLSESTTTKKKEGSVRSARDSNERRERG